MFEYNYSKLHHWAKEVAMEDAKKDLDRKHSRRLQKLTVEFYVNIDFLRVQEFMAWLEVGLRVFANEKGYEITNRELE